MLQIIQWAFFWSWKNWFSCIFQDYYVIAIAIVSKNLKIIILNNGTYFSVIELNSMKYFENSHSKYATVNKTCPVHEMKLMWERRGNGKIRMKSSKCIKNKAWYQCRFDWPLSKWKNKTLAFDSVSCHKAMWTTIRSKSNSASSCYSWFISSSCQESEQKNSSSGGMKFRKK